MTSLDSRALVDANILVYALFSESEHYAAARSLFERAQREEISLCLAPQILIEFYAVVTDSRRVTAARKPEEALAAIEKYLELPGMTVLPVPSDVVARWIELVRRRPVTRGKVFDHQLVATMLGNGVRRLYTYNGSHFEGFEELEVLTP